MVLGAVVGVAAGQVIGALWYSQLLFGAVWMKHAYPQQTKKLEFTVSTLGIAFAGQATMALLLSYIMPMLQVASVVTAIKTGLGLAALVSIADVPHIAFNRRSFVVYLIDHSFDAALLATMCACITYFE